MNLRTLSILTASLLLFLGCAKDDDSNTQTTPEKGEVPALPADPQPENTSFVHRIMLLQHTGTACPNCPRLMVSLKELAEDKDYAEKYQHVASHSYNTDDPAYSKAASQISGQSRAYPDLSFNLGAESTGNDTSLPTIKEYIDRLHKDAADVGIAASAGIEGKTVTVNVQIKAAVENNYRVAAWILEDDIEAEQDGAVAPWQNIHENALRAFSGNSLNMGVYGERLGDLKAGETAEKVLAIVLEDGWKAENCKVLVIANSSDQGRYDLANCIICPIGGSVTYDYK
jgi:hypothetical protein